MMSDIIHGQSAQSTVSLQPQSDVKIIEETMRDVAKGQEITEVWEAIQIEGTS